ncbi:MAG: outer membrane beta-barrel protein [Bradymonadia bacterium]
MSLRLASALAAGALLTAGAVGTASAQDVQKQATQRPGKVVGSLGFQMGIASQYEFDHDDTNLQFDAQDADLTLAIIPAVEKMLGQSVAFGAEYMFVWAKGDGADERHLIMSPHVRARMSFPVGDKVSVGAMFGIGPSIWTSAGDAEPLDSTRFGWSYRFAFGGSFAINNSVSAFADVGYYCTRTYGDDYTTTFDNIPVTVGLRSNF